MNRIQRFNGLAAGALALLGAGVLASPAGAQTVTRATDDMMPGSLRYELTTPASGPVITIDPAVDPVVGPNQIVIDRTVTLRGAGMNTTKITGPAANRVFAMLPTHTFTIEDLELSGGHAPAGNEGSTFGGDGTDGQSGGAITLDAGVLNVNSVRFSDNHAGNGGDGVGGLPSGGDGQPGGSGGEGGEGGAIFLGSTGSLNVDDSVFIGNTAGEGGLGAQGGAGGPPVGDGGAGGSGGGGGFGGAISDFSDGTLTITDSSFSANHAGNGGNGDGGGSGSPDGDAGNGGSGGRGGAIVGSVYTVSSSTFGANTAGNGGAGGSGQGSGNGGGGGFGGAISASANLTLTNSTFTGNESGFGGQSGTLVAGAGGDGGVGGAIHAFEPSTITNVTVDSNVAKNGGAGSPGGAPGSGAGVFGVGSMTFPTTLRNSVVSNNTAQPAVTDANCAGSLTFGPFNLHFPAANSGCTGTVGNPLLGPLANNGGPTETMALGGGSPAINAVPATGAGCPATDQRGIIRPQGSACDLGAFEVFVPPVTPIAVSPPGAAPVASARKRCPKGKRLKKVRGKKRCVRKKKKP